MWMLLGIVLAGLAASSVTWLLLRAISASGRVGGSTYVPVAWRLAWPWLSAWSAVLGRHLTWRQREWLTAWAQQAGLPPCVTPAHLCACGVSVALMGTFVGFYLAVLADSRQAQAYAMLFGAVFAVVWLGSVLDARVQRRRRIFERSLPFMLDMITLCVESGLSLHSALHLVAKMGPPGPLRDEVSHALTDMRAGVPRQTALQALVTRCGSPTVRAWVLSMQQAAESGMSLSVFLREHAAHTRLQRVQRAETLAMEAPVRMLLPLIGCIFPCTFIVLAFPIVVQIWGGG
ncbi:type II secretion system F family protein [Bordetella sp. 15P40C-2]|nr:type II secretion system F family protein [Bordetella sp. 15P40C-2]MVW78826.1 type II secretion system F family protein [Bordetella sp. 02P26C-1]